MVLYCDGMRKNQEEMGISSIAACLRESGYQVTLMSMDEESINNSKIKELEPDIIGIPVYEINKEFAYSMIGNIKELMPKVITIVGGILPTYWGKQMLKECKYIDYAIVGEGELAWLDIASSYCSDKCIEQVKSLIYRKGEEVYENQRQPLIANLDTLPFPARDIMLQNKLKIAQISTSRGCFASCSFCASQLFWKKWRGRSVKHIVDEIETLVKRYEIRFFNVIDSSFEDPITDIERLYGIANEIINRKLSIFYYVQLRAEFHKVATDDLMHILKKSGLSSVCVGIESGNSEDLRLYNKIANLDDINKMIARLREYEINVEPGFINFNPYSTLQQLKQNIDFLEKNMFACNIEYVTTPCKLYEGTALYKKVQKDLIEGRMRYAYKGYVFRDSKVSLICEYVNLYTSQERRARDVFRAAGFYATRWLTAIACYKNMFQPDAHREALRILLDYENIHLAICDKLNHSIALWFSSLIHLAENGWSETEADCISEAYLSIGYVEMIVMDFNHYRHRFNRQIIRIDLDYANQLLDFIVGS